MNLVYAILIGMFAGWIAGQLTKGSGFGLLGNLIVGVLGALIGGFLFTLLGLSSRGLIGHLITAVAGAVVLLFALQMISRGRR